MSLTDFDLIPVFGVVVTIAGISLKAGMILQKLDHVVEDVAELKRDMKEVKTMLQEHEERLTGLKIAQRIRG